MLLLHTLIMGRSENSRNRIFVEDGEGIRTQAFDPSKLIDPSLYHLRTGTCPWKQDDRKKTATGQIPFNEGMDRRAYF